MKQSGVRDCFNSIQELLKDTLAHLKQKRRRFECLKDCFNEEDELKVWNKPFFTLF